ncbi:O-antigen ligase [Paenibacillus sp. yr247]|uniref:O-antigen ligase family protein n=1 Tax=Paenibacillus sp. yr247 TaxID=1761880 RepID=UPI0008927252|nr:O-antigen ligase family protein [Paenibacillus sp. yr247]SDN32500.1 O-antigen ligase [Paenibacillus sp. yr247]
MLIKHGGVMKGIVPFSDTPKIYFLLLWFAMIMGSFVFIEPSPYDVLFLTCIVVGFTFSYFGLPYFTLPALFMFLLFFISNLISMYFVTGSMTSSISFVAITVYLILTWICLVGLLKRYRRKILDLMFTGYTTAAIIAAAVGNLAYFKWIPQYESFLLFDRVKFLFKDPNVFGPFLIPAVLFCLWRFESTKRSIHKVIWICMFFLTILGVLFSYSRAAWGNCLIALLLYAILPSEVSKRQRLISLVTLIIILGLSLVILYGQPSVYDMLMHRLKYQQYDNDRFGTQYNSLINIMDAPFGIGPGQIENVFGMSSHSLYVRISAEYGIVGVLSFFSFIGLTAIRAVRHVFRSRSKLLGNPIHPYMIIAAASLFGILFNSFFIDTLHWRHLWILLALPWIPLNEKEGDEKDQNRSNHNSF